MSNLEVNWLINSLRASLVLVWVAIKCSIKLSKLDLGCSGRGGGWSGAVY